MNGRLLVTAEILGGINAISGGLKSIRGSRQLSQGLEDPILIGDFRPRMKDVFLGVAPGGNHWTVWLGGF